MPGGACEARLAWVDVAKGLCIVLVVTMHATLGTGEAMAEAGLGGEGFLHPVVAFARPFRIPAFFLLSGLFLGRVIDRDWRLFADRRVVHFAYFYGLWVVIQSVAKSGQIVDGAGPGAFVRHLALALVEPYSTLWFIYLLAVFSVATKLLRRVPWPLLLGVAAVLQVLPIRTESGLVEEFCARYVWFVVGYLFAARLFDFAARVRAHPRPVLAGLALWAVTEAILVGMPSGDSGFPTLASLPGLSLVLGAAGSLALVAGASLLDRAGGPVTAALRACGQRSLTIYLAFFLPMALTRALVVRTGLITDVGWASLLVTGIALLAPLAVERMVRPTPLRFLFRRPAALHLAGTRAAARPTLTAA